MQLVCRKRETENRHRVDSRGAHARGCDGRGPHLRELLDLLPRVVRLDPLHERNILMPEPRSADVHAVVRGDEGVGSLQLVSRLVKWTQAWVQIGKSGM